MNPYEVLGVERDATPEQLKKARRKIAKECHPDREGADPERMSEANRAYDILSDPDARKHYDETGKTGGAQDLEKAAIETLRSGVKSIIVGGKLKRNANLIAMLHDTVAEARKEINDQLAIQPEVLENVRARLEKISSKGEGTLLQDSLRMAIDGIEGHIKNLNKGILILDRAVELLDQYTDSTLEFDMQQAMNQQQQYKSPYLGLQNQNFFKRVFP